MEKTDCRGCKNAWYHEADYESSEESGWACDWFDKENDSRFPYKNTKCLGYGKVKQPQPEIKE